ncbi:MAG: 2-amino-4-hydroxy-6-hydroxymethyldihydropteridine diphosphokinase, partial [Aeromonas veronii]
DDLICDQPVNLPRAEIITNAFVLWPLAELAPERRHPLTQARYGDLWAAYDKQSQRLQPVDFDWAPPSPKVRKESLTY